MAKKTKNQKQKLEKNQLIANRISDRRIIQILVVIIALLILTIVFLLLFLTKLQQSLEEKTNTPDTEWLNENCQCVEHNGTRSCLAGFEIGEGNTFCRNTRKKTFTNVLIACSKYKCPEYFVDLNETEG